ncbi:hypothetical protein [Candidatus Tisiphia endosymbiont of Temnostethus pusillus]|uniref:hypothetical protein n=1 Tax=Candidatus Tisiphia endosymbiont of Temnostethus pusillus TaxID=3139335 RepID=UPI0035C8C41D
MIFTRLKYYLIILIIIISYQAFADNREEFFIKHNFSNEQISTKGEWLYGQDIVKEKLIPSIPNINIPYQFVFSKEILPSDIAKTIKSLPKKQYVIKYSLYDEKSFSYKNMRGVNSSRSRKINFQELNIKGIVDKIQQYISIAPQTCKYLVLQELINQTGGYLFHTEFKKDTMEIDILWENSTARAFAKFFNGELTEYESIPGLGVSSETKSTIIKLSYTIDKINKLLTTFYGEVAWSIEGFYYSDKDQVSLLQLRPKPLGREFLKTRKLDEVILYSTNFNWGNYNIGPLKLKDIDQHQDIILQTSPCSTELDTNIKRRIENKKHTLIIDPYRGFALSHEKWFLPIQNKDYYSFIYIPPKILMIYANHQVRIFSSNGKGFMSLFSKFNN